MPESVTSRPPAPRARASRRAPGRAMISSERISKRVRQLGREISEVYGDIETPLVIVAILKGATVFAADLLGSVPTPAELEFVRAASYGAGTKTSGRVKIAHMVEGSLAGRHVLLVEDIVDSGRTIHTILKKFRRMKPASLRVAALLDRPARREIAVQIDFTGFVIPDRFVIGYGLDYAGLYRELPRIYALSQAGQPPSAA